MKGKFKLRYINGEGLHNPIEVIRLVDDFDMSSIEKPVCFYYDGAYCLLQGSNKSEDWVCVIDFDAIFKIPVDSEEYSDTLGVLKGWYLREMTNNYIKLI